MQEVFPYLLEPSVLIYALLGGLILLLLLFALFIRHSLRLARLERKYQRLVGGAPAGNLEEVLGSLNDELKATKSELLRVDKNQGTLAAKMRTSLRGLSLVRYNAFHDTGSDLSFSLALLDENRDGMILSALYGREECRTYAKPVRGGGSSYHLSDEESKVLRQAAEALREGGDALVP